MTESIKVMVVDDSIVVRGFLRKIIETDHSFTLISTASDGASAVRDYQTYTPDIMLLDIEMPVMDGLSALDAIIKFDKDARVIICSSLTQKGAEISLRALDKGAIDYLSKPSSATIERTTRFEDELLLKLRTLNKRAKSIKIKPVVVKHDTPAFSKKEIHDVLSQGKAENITLKDIPVLTRQFPLVLAIGASTGGPRALVDFFKQLDKKIMIPVFITQHIPIGFSKLLAENIEKSTGFKTCEAEEGMIVEPGHVYMAPGQKHMGVSKTTPKRIILSDAPPVNFCKPSIDVMLDSIGNAYAGNILTVLLTGMGSDGTAACRRLSALSPSNIVMAQDEASSVVWGIPGSVVKEGLAHVVAPLDQIGYVANSFIKNQDLFKKEV